MSDVLSQSEIDALFKALTEGDMDIDNITDTSEQKSIKEYDFKRPSKFSKEQLRTLEIIFENYARLISTYLSGHLRTAVTVEVMTSEAVTYAEFSNALHNPVILGIADFRPLKGSILLELSTNMGYTIIERVLGGGGDGSGPAITRDLTDIERIILERILMQFVESLTEPWQNVIDIEPKLEKLETNSQVVQIISPNEIVALITLNIKIGSVAGMLNVCIPHLVLEPIMDKLNTKFWFSQQEQELEPTYETHMEKMIEKAKVPVRAILGKTHITVNEFLELTREDVIKLDRDIDSDIDIYVGNIFKFTGTPGQYKNKVAIKINQVMIEEDE